MNIETFEQGSPEWLNARLSVATASEFSKVITSTGKASSQADDYAKSLAVEGFIGKAEKGFKSAAMERGNELEPDARALYEFIKDVEVEQVGMIYKDSSKRISCSPDGLMPQIKKGLEIKCPELHTHVTNLFNESMPNAYIPQVQGSMWVTGYEQWDFMSYHPDLPPLIVTIEKDVGYHRKMDELFKEFLLTKKRYEIKLKELLK